MNIQFDQAPSGRWYYVSADGQQHDHVMAVRSFPVSAPEEGIALVDVDGKELLWIPHLNLLADPARTQIVKAIKTIKPFLLIVLQGFSMGKFM